MARPTHVLTAAVLMLALALAPAAQSVYPTGTTIYNPSLPGTVTRCFRRWKRRRRS